MLGRVRAGMSTIHMFSRESERHNPASKVSNNVFAALQRSMSYGKYLKLLQFGTIYKMFDH
jgi:hypothetical protein